jgi:hypothetical protein
VAEIAERLERIGPAFGRVAVAISGRSDVYTARGSRLRRCASRTTVLSGCWNVVGQDRPFDKEMTNMKIARLFILALVAASAASTMATSTAAAIPKFKLPITLRGFTASSSTSVIRIPTAAAITITCGRDLLSGTIIDDDEVDARIHFLGCTLMHGTEGPCEINSFGGTNGLIITELLTGLLGLLHSPNGGAGILLAPKAPPHIVELEATACNTPEATLDGNVAGLFSPTSKLQTTAKIVISTSGGEQEIKLILTLAGSVKPALEAYGAGPALAELEEKITFQEAVEVD